MYWAPTAQCLGAFPWKMWEVWEGNRGSASRRWEGLARLHQRDYVHPSSQAGEVQLAQEWVWLDPGCSTHGQGNISAAQGGTRGTLEDDCGNRSQIPSTKTGFISRNCTATANPPSPKSTTASNGSPQMLMAFVVVV